MTSNINALTCQNLTYHLAEGDCLFHQLNLVFNANRTAIVGDNGRGKTTLLQLLSGKLLPTVGKIHCNGSIFLLAQQNIHTRMSLLDLCGFSHLYPVFNNIERGQAEEIEYEMMEEYWSILEKIQPLLKRFSLHHFHWLDRVTHLSGGEIKQLLLAVAWQQEVDYLLLDEPNNHLDKYALEQLIKNIRDSDKKLILTTHNRLLLNEMDEIIDLNPPDSGKVYQGNGDFYFQELQRHDEKVQLDIVHITAVIKKEKQKLIKQHDNQQKRLAKGKKEGKTENQSKIILDKKKGQAEKFSGQFNQFYEDKKIQFVQEKMEKIQLLHKNEVCFLMPKDIDIPSNKLIASLENIKLPWRDDIIYNTILQGPVRIGLIGKNGAGKSSLLKILCGEFINYGGELKTYVPISYIDQHISFLKPDYSISQQLLELGCVFSQTELYTALRLLGFEPHQFKQQHQTMSGGERIKAALAIAAWQNNCSQLLLLDEPDNHLDINAQQALIQCLNDYMGAMIVVSHHQNFLQQLHLTHYWNLDDSSSPQLI